MTTPARSSQTTFDLRKIPLLSALANEELARVAGDLRVRQYAKQETVINKGSSGDALLLVRRLSQGRTPVRVRIGVESGSAVAGDLGTPFRSVYTAVGDSVNVAARLQELARDYPCDIIVGMGTAALTRRHRLRPLGVVTLRGRAQEETLFTPVTVDTGPPPVSGLPHEQQDVAESRRRAEVP